MTIATVLLGILSTIASAFSDALRAKDESVTLAIARNALLNSIAEIESAEARAKFPELREP